MNIPKIAKNIKTTDIMSIMLTMLKIKSKDLINKTIAMIKAKLVPKLNFSKIMLSAANKSIIPNNLVIIKLRLRINLNCFWWKG